MADPREPPRSDKESRGSYSLRDVMTAERRAWAEHAGSVYHFDGINFWRRLGPRWLAATWGDLPHTGWWHVVTCNCRLCEREGSGEDMVA